MAETLTSIQIRPTTRDQLRRVKAQVAEEAKRTVDYDDMVQALMRVWAQASPDEVSAALHQSSMDVTSRYMTALSGEGS